MLLKNVQKILAIILCNQCTLRNLHDIGLVVDTERSTDDLEIFTFYHSKTKNIYKFHSVDVTLKP